MRRRHILKHIHLCEDDDCLHSRSVEVESEEAEWWISLREPLEGMTGMRSIAVFPGNLLKR